MVQAGKYRKAIGILCVAVLLVTLFFGLKPKGFRFHNQVEWLQDRNGINFKNIGMAYSQKTLGEIGISDSISIVAELKPFRTGRQLSKIISIVDDEGRELLVFQQWQKGVEVVLWDTAQNRMRKIGLGDALSKDASRLTAISISRSEMKLFSEKLPGVRRSRRINLPLGFLSRGRLILGLSVNGTSAWRGEIRGLALFKNELSEETIQACSRVWKNGESLSALAKNPPAALYLFDGRAGNNIADRSGNGWNLHIPIYPKFFKYEVLMPFPDSNKIDRGLLLDIIINFFGFFPIGGCAYMLFLSSGSSGRKSAILAVACAVFISFGIELIQAFIPTRSSQLIDVFFNGAGAWTCVMLMRLGFRFLSHENASL
jgi:VanZ family protein